MTVTAWRLTSSCHLDDGRYALIECRLGGSGIEKGAGQLLKLRDLIRKHNTEEKQMPIREQDLLIVLTGGEMAVHALTA